jgi:hypothetical protein
MRTLKCVPGRNEKKNGLAMIKRQSVVSNRMIPTGTNDALLVYSPADDLGKAH